MSHTSGASEQRGRWDDERVCGHLCVSGFLEDAFSSKVVCVTEAAACVHAHVPLLLNARLVHSGVYISLVPCRESTAVKQSSGFCEAL